MQRSSTVKDGLHWDDVKLFLALCRSRSVGKAARSLRVDASTVSRRIAALEEAIGATLFERGRDGVSLTKAAEELMPAAEAIENAMAGFSTAAEGLERQVSGLVRITCPSDVADVVVVPLLPELLRRHPDLRIELDPGETLLDLSRREADVALRTVRPQRGDLIVTRLVTVSWILAAAPGLADELGTLEKWIDAPWVGWGERHAQKAAPARWHAKHLGDAEPALRSDSLRIQLAAVAAGIGVALVPSASLTPYGLVPVKLGRPLRRAADEWPKDELYLVTHRALRDVPRVRVVWERLLESMRT